MAGNARQLPFIEHFLMNAVVNICRYPIVALRTNRVDLRTRHRLHRYYIVSLLMTGFAGELFLIYFFFRVWRSQKSLLYRVTRQAFLVDNDILCRLNIMGTVTGPALQRRVRHVVAGTLRSIKCHTVALIAVYIR